MNRIVAALVATAVLSAPSVLADTPSLEGRPAPRLDGGVHIGTRVPSLNDLKGKVVLLFFWAHGCMECRAESPTVAKLVDKYRSQGLVIIAPTQRYGIVEGGRPAPPDRELRYIIQIRDTHYSFLHDAPVPVGEANHKAYGADVIPLHVLIDRQGIVRRYQTGRMTEEELEAAIRALL
jgi:cytochrome c biogenesis protein CcmG, thiol:disulfide interchange protein DsbE